jgi:hypothetical protein
MRNLGVLAQVQAKTGDIKGAQANAREIDTMPKSGIEHYNAACFISLAVAAIRDSRSPEDDRDPLVKSISDLAVAQVGKAIAAGYKNVKLMRTDPDLAAISDREDFGKLVEQLENDLKTNP